MSKKIFVAVSILIMGLCAFLPVNNAFAGCMLDAEFTDSTGIGELDISVSSDGKTVEGYLKVINSDVLECPVKVDLRVYNAAEKKIASKSVSFGSIASGAETTNKFILTAKKKLCAGQAGFTDLNGSM